ncbi:TetR/AcrR family transcriptional regulator [Brevibacterium luteolum]|uniref:TetR/AcrR family transcriptional regulator n=1 Tax=Brevibacterium luteolum TaxID=199591 RepID=UPI00223B1235|nr:TetR/AcrR family transcriptional regulator [Brevibacterium luteolum]MCT1658285.1 TetR/AcrR family transcriptional regulator [Brevibacterium luteolum]
MKLMKPEVVKRRTSISDPGEQRGRPREDVDDHILDCVIQLLVERGYDGLSMRAIAERAGVSVPLIYRRWKDKSDVVGAAVSKFRSGRTEPTGELEADLIAQVEDMLVQYRTVVNPSIAGVLLAQERNRPELIDTWRRQVIRPRRELIASLIDDGKRSGRINETVDSNLFAQAMVGAIYAATFAGDEMDEGWPKRLVHTILHGVLIK